MFLRTFISVVFVVTATFCAPCFFESEEMHGNGLFTEKQSQSCECDCHESKPIHVDQEQTAYHNQTNNNLVATTERVHPVSFALEAKPAVRENYITVPLVNSALPNVLRI